MKEKIVLSWSGGKDSSLSLYEFIKQDRYDITLLTTVTAKYGRSSMHGIREALIDKQAENLGLKLEKIYISADCSNEEYETKMKDAMERYKALGITKIAFGDIFLEDIRKYRQANLDKAGMEAIFPVWGRDSAELANTFIDLGFEAIITCVDTKALNKEFSGRLYDKVLLSELPKNIDPCGENGEFHTFVSDGPIFAEKIEYSAGEKVLRNGRFYYCDLIPQLTIL